MPRTMPAPQDIQKALELLRQRGASIRSMSLPQVPQTTLPAEISSAALSGVLPAAEGGLMSVVRRQSNPGSLSMSPALIQAAEDIRAGQTNQRPSPPTSLEGSYKQFLGADPLGWSRDPAIGERDRQLQTIADLVKSRKGKLEERQETLAGRERQAQFGNLAQFFARLGTDVSPAAQAGGLRGLLGAGVSAGAQTLPEVKETREDYYGRQLELEDLTAQAELEGLQADLAVTESGIAHQKEVDQTFFNIRKEQTAMGIDMRTADAAYQSAMAEWAENTGADSADINSSMKTLGHLLGAEIQITSDGSVFLNMKGVGQGQEAFTNLAANYVAAMSRSGLTGGEAQDHAIGSIWKERREFQGKSEEEIPTGTQISVYLEAMRNPNKQFTPSGGGQPMAAQAVIDLFEDEYEPNQPEIKYWSGIYSG